MRYIEATSDTPVISELSCQVEDDCCVLRWHWPPGLRAVYIARSAADTAPLAAVNAPGSGLKLYTRAEYKANGGYFTRLEGIGRHLYTVYAVLEGEEGPRLVRQADGANEIAVSAGKAKIRYALHYKNNWFKPVKAVTIRISAEVPVPREALCYVKKQGSAPASREDGLMYPFVSDFDAGSTILPPIEVGKQEYIRLFFTDGRTYGQLYELIPL